MVTAKTIPQGLKLIDFAKLLYGLKPVPFEASTYPEVAEVLERVKLPTEPCAIQGLKSEIFHPTDEDLSVGTPDLGYPRWYRRKRSET